MPLVKSIIATLLLVPAVSFAACIVPAYHAEYNVDAGSASGTLVQDFTKSGNQYNFKSVTKAHVLFFSDTITETSQGTIKGTSVVPQRYEIVDTHDDQPFVATFDWGGKMVKTTYNGKKVALNNIASDTEDNLSYQLVMRRELASGYSKMFHFPVPALNKSKQPYMKSVLFSAPHKTLLKTKLGTLKTLKLVSVDRTTKATTTYWFAPSLNYLLVKSQTKQDGDVKATVTITSYRPQKGVCVIG